MKISKRKFNLSLPGLFFLQNLLESKAGTVSAPSSGSVFVKSWRQPPKTGLLMTKKRVKQFVVPAGIWTQRGNQKCMITAGNLPLSPLLQRLGRFDPSKRRSYVNIPGTDIPATHEGGVYANEWPFSVVGKTSFELRVGEAKFLDRRRVEEESYSVSSSTKFTGSKRIFQENHIALQSMWRSPEDKEADGEVHHTYAYLSATENLTGAVNDDYRVAAESYIKFVAAASIALLPDCSNIRLVNPEGVYKADCLIQQHKQLILANLQRPLPFQEFADIIGLTPQNTKERVKAAKDLLQYDTRLKNQLYLDWIPYNIL